MSEDKLSEEEVNHQLQRLEKAFRRHDSMLIGWLAGKFGDRDTARDIAQDAYLRVWRFAHRIEIENPQALLFKTAANLAANEFRAQQRFRARHTEQQTQDDHDHIQALPSDAPSPEQASCARSDVEISMAAIEKLPDKVRNAFIMNRFQEKSYREIANELGVSVSSVEKYMITALKALRAAVNVQKQEKTKIIAFPTRKKHGAK